MQCTPTESTYGVEAAEKFEPVEIIGVYFLLLGGRVQYVGQSINVAGRVNTHRQEGRIPFNSVRFLKTIQGQLLVVERAMIEKYQPPFNSQWTDHQTIPERIPLFGSGEQSSFQVRMPSELHGKLKELSDYESRTRNNMVCYIISKHWDRMRELIFEDEARNTGSIYNIT